MDLRRLFRSPQSRSRVPEGTVVYAVGDIHGRLDLLDGLHRRMTADARSRGDVRPVAVYLGDYIDRGPRSREVVESLINNPLEGFKTVHLKGNHEDMMLTFLDEPESGPRWLANGGFATLASYGVENAPCDAEGLIQTAKALAEALPPTHLRFLSSLSLTHRIGDYVFVHAGVRPGIALDEQSEEDLIWIRGPFLTSDADHGAVVVHGHTPGPRPIVKANRICVDTGAYATDVLTCVILEGDDRRFLSTER